MTITIEEWYFREEHGYGHVTVDIHGTEKQFDFRTEDAGGMKRGEWPKWLWDGDTSNPSLSASIQAAGEHFWIKDGEITTNP